jgi:hypothetical protein
LGHWLVSRGFWYWDSAFRTEFQHFILRFPYLAGTPKRGVRGWKTGWLYGFLYCHPNKFEITQNCRGSKSKENSFNSWPKSDLVYLVTKNIYKLRHI